MMIDNEYRLKRTLAASCLLTAVACQGQLAVVDDTIHTVDSDLSTDIKTGMSPRASTADPLETDCPCAQSSALMALTCGSLTVPPLGNDSIQTNADGSAVALMLESKSEPALSNTIAYWRAGSGTRVLGESFLVGLDGAGDSVAMWTGGDCSGADTCSVEITLLDIPGESQVLRFGPTLSKNSLSRDGMSLLGTLLENGIWYLARATRGGTVDRLASLGKAQLAGRGYAAPNGAMVVGNLFATEGDADPLDGEDTTDYIGTPFRWTDAGGLVLGFGELPPGAEVPVPQAVSDDGAVVAGSLVPRLPPLSDEIARVRGFRWSESTGIVDIGAPGGGGGHLFLSADGTVQVDTARQEGSQQHIVYRWQEATGAVELVSGSNVGSEAMSDDGDVIAGHFEIDGALRTFVWDPVHGTRQLQDMLELQGVDLSNWTFTTPRVLSRNGKVLLGEALCDGAPALYRVELPE